MTFFNIRGNTVTVSAEGAVDIRDHLPVGTYAVKFDMQSMSYFLERVANFRLDHKIYGSTPKTADRVMRTFKSRPNSTGIMLTGEKGSGKTMLAKLLSVNGLKDGISTILVNEAFFGEGFNTFIQSIQQEIIVIFDEFEKVYDREQQERMLTLLDGVFPSKKMFILTCNDKYRVDTHMKNRPGRIFYRIEYSGLETEFIREYCLDNLDDTSHTETICKMASVFPTFNFDMLKAMIEEMNRYKETPHEVLELLNAKPEHGESSTFDAELTVNGEPVITRQTWIGNPISGNLTFYWHAPGTDDEMSDLLKGIVDEDGEGSSSFTLGNLLKVDPATNSFEFATEQGEHLRLTKQAPTSLNWSAVV